MPCRDFSLDLDFDLEHFLADSGDGTWTCTTLLFFRFQRAGSCICFYLLAPTWCPLFRLACSSLLGLACEHNSTKTATITTHSE